MTAPQERRHVRGAFALDPVGDVYLVGRIPLAAIYAGGDRPAPRVRAHLLRREFDRALELGFAASIRREWEWRVKRGESLANLQAFARFADPER